MSGEDVRMRFCVCVLPSVVWAVWISLCMMCLFWKCVSWLCGVECVWCVQWCEVYVYFACVFGLNSEMGVTWVSG